MSNYYYHGFAQRHNKYGAKKVTVNGEKFDSEAEAKRDAELRMLERAKVISNLRRQVTYELIPKQYDSEGKLIEHACKYIADFVYDDSNHKTVVEDCKGYTQGAAYNLFVIKRKLMLQKYGIKIKEINLHK